MQYIVLYILYCILFIYSIAIYSRKSLIRRIKHHDIKDPCYFRSNLNLTGCIIWDTSLDRHRAKVIVFSGKDPSTHIASGGGGETAT